MLQKVPEEDGKTMRLFTGEGKVFKDWTAEIGTKGVHW